jgi:Domain of unknown function (DUF4276)
MSVRHLVFLVEEPSTEAFLRELLPRFLPVESTFEIHAFQGKHDLLGKLAARLRAYSTWLPAHWRLVVLVDRDDEECRQLKARLESAATLANLRTRSRTRRGKPWQLVNRIAIEELEAWYFGDWVAVCAAFPKVSPDVINQAAFRKSDEIRGGTWEAFERVLRKRGYFNTGLGKIEAARRIAFHVDPSRSRSPSFNAFCAAVMEAVA